MASELFGALEASLLARSLRDSVWAYPLVNAAHIAGVALLVGAIVPLDLKLLGVWRSVPLDPLWQVLSATALAGVTLATTFGALLFIARASEYAASTLFLAKMAALSAGAANALVLRMRMRMRAAHSATLSNGTLTRGVRVAAAISLAAWITTLALGRLVGYF